MCGMHLSAQTSSLAKIPLRAFLLGAAMSLVLAAPASASTDCVMGSKAAVAGSERTARALYDVAGDAALDAANSFKKLAGEIG